MKNILFIMGDQHRFDCIGAYGNKDIKTPSLDSLAGDGVRHNEHFTTYPVCTPARYSLLTGLYTHQHLGWSNHCTLPDAIPTYAKTLRTAGYTTSAIGKMHATPTYMDMGFDKMILAEQDGNGRYDDEYHQYLMDLNLVDENDIIDQRQEFRKNASKEYWDTNGSMPSNLADEHHSTTWITNRALDELENWTESKNMMIVSYIKPHHPFDPPKPYDTIYNPDELTILDGYTPTVPEVDYTHSKGYFDHANLSEEKLRTIMAHYYGSISHMDFHIGRLLDALKAKGLYDDTLIIYTSDHGEYMGFHHMMLKGNYMYDPLAKVPLLIKYPQNAHRAHVNDLISNNTDIAPTILREAGVEVPKSMKGLHLANQEVGREMTVCEGLRIESDTGETPYYEYMVRSKGYKLIISKNFTNCRFFDLTKDPLELEDVAGNKKYNAEIERHKAHLAQMMVFDDLSPTYLNYDEKTCTPEKKTDYARRKIAEDYFTGKC